MGKAYIVGCGPGNKDLLTVKAVKIIEEADTIIYDHLVNPEILDYARQGARRIYVGKKPYVKRISQEEINRIIVEETLKFHVVVRLKGGDPFMFGRGGEEIEELIKNNIEYEIVPGISSLIAVPESAGIPLTHRNVNHGILVTTGNNVENLNIPDCRTFKCRMYTMVIFMGAHNLKGIIATLLSAGYDPSLPIALIENGTYNYQKTFTGKLGSINYTYNESPSLIVIGDVVPYHEIFCQSENRKYSGKIITIFYDLYPPDTGYLESMGFTVFKIRSADVFPGDVSTTALYGKNIACDGRFTSILMDIFKSSGFDLRWLGKIATDSTGKILLQKYGIFDVCDISRADSSYIKIGFTNQGEVQAAKLRPVEMGSYMEDYISKSDLIIIGSQSDDLPDGIHIPDKTGIIRVKYPYKNLNSVVMSYFGGKNEEN
jgi:uroporphyrin-III C-methyltransferase